MDICTTKNKVASQKQLELACSNHGMVGPLTFEVQSIKLEINYSAHQKRYDWKLGGFQNNTSSTEVVNLFCWNHTEK